MLRIILLVVFFPFIVEGQNSDPRIKHTAPAPGVKLVTEKIVRYYRTQVEYKDYIVPGIPVMRKRDTIVSDTVVAESRHYSPDGKIDSSDRTFVYRTHSIYTHSSDAEWKMQTWHEGNWFDLTEVNNDTAITTRQDADYRFCTVCIDDSCRSETYNSKGKRTYKRDYCSSARDSFWDYVSGGPFTRKIVSHAGNRDTVLYLDSKGRWMVKVINHYDSAGHPVMSEYYNRSVKKFDLVSMWANHHIGDATLYLPQKGDQKSMIARRTYDTNGLLVQEAWFRPEDETATVVRYYSYAYY